MLELKCLQIFHVQKSQWIKTCNAKFDQTETFKADKINWDYDG